MSQNKIINLGDPTDDEDATNKLYVDTQITDKLAIQQNNTNNYIAAV